MDDTTPLAFLAKLKEERGIEGIQDFARLGGFKWATVYRWLDRASVPDWRQEAFKKAMTAYKKRGGGDGKRRAGVDARAT